MSLNFAWCIPIIFKFLIDNVIWDPDEPSSVEIQGIIFEFFLFSSIFPSVTETSSSPGYYIILNESSIYSSNGLSQLILGSISKYFIKVLS